VRSMILIGNGSGVGFEADFPAELRDSKKEEQNLTQRRKGAKTQRKDRFERWRYADGKWAGASRIDYAAPMPEIFSLSSLCSFAAIPNLVLPLRLCVRFFFVFFATVWSPPGQTDLNGCNLPREMVRLLLHGSHQLSEMFRASL